jgi:hypothetical protein
VRMRFGFPTGAALALLGLAAPVHAQVNAGPELHANTYITGTQRNPGIAMQANGDFVVTWTSAAQDGNGDGIFAQRFGRDGSTRGGEFQVNTFTTGAQAISHVGIGANGSFVIVWAGLNQDGSSNGIFGQRYDASGARMGGEFQVNTYTTGAQYYATAAMDRRGNFVVAWASGGQDGNVGGIFARRFAAGGAAIGAEFQVNTFTIGSQDTGKVAMAPDGGFVIVWESAAQDGDSDGIFGQLFDAAGARVGAEFQANTYITSIQGDPAVGMGADGRFVVAWESSEGGAGQEIRSQRFDASGARVGAEFAVNTYTPNSQFMYSIGVDALGNYVLAWDDSGRDGGSFGAFGWRTSWENTRRGVEFQANTYTTGYQGLTNVASDEVGNFIVAWHSDQDGGTINRGIYVQRFGGLFPSALAVDPGGNLVWEPNETVEVRPSWRNLNGAGQTFGGTLASVTGPAGGTYGSTDPTADYGTVANNTTQQCTDCYSVVNVITSRPQTHVDAAAVESITPDILGQQKGWKLHIGGSFADVPASNPFYRFIETLLHYSVTAGCTATNYCPGNSTTREQMSVFVLIAKEGAGYTPPACTTPIFEDVPASSPFCRFIEELSRRGVVNGCSTNPSNYCPGDPVTREQMAVFVLRTLDPTFVPPPCTGTPQFGDVPNDSPFCPWIAELSRRGVVTGCGGGNYCPTLPVTREQMGVFISLTFGLALYGL